MRKQKQGIPVIHLVGLDEDERNIATQILDTFGKANIPFCIVDNDSQKENVLCLHCINDVPQKDIDEIKNELFDMFSDIEIVAITSMTFKS